MGARNECQSLKLAPRSAYSLLMVVGREGEKRRQNRRMCDSMPVLSCSPFSGPDLIKIPHASTAILKENQHIN